MAMIRAIKTKVLSVTPAPIPAFAPVGSLFVLDGEGDAETTIVGEGLTEASLIDVKRVVVENEVKACIMEPSVVGVGRLKLEEDDETVEEDAELLETLKLGNPRLGGPFITIPACARTSLNKIARRNIWIAIFAIEKGLEFIGAVSWY
jgi:hypothetical protein